MNHDGEELKELAHEAQPGFAPAFLIVFGVMILMLVLYFAFAGGGGGH
jgi:hypothetical protein